MNEKSQFFWLNFVNKMLCNKAVIGKSVSPQNILSLINKLHPRVFEKGLIRLGAKGDGGYLVPDDLNEIEACFSPGVSNVSEFELDCIKRGMKVFMADKSVDSPNLNIPKNQYSFIKKFIGTINNEDYMTMNNWVESSNVSEKSDLLLQMDIEGCEYTSLLNTSDGVMKRFRIIVIEFHYFKDLWNQRFFNLVENTIDYILQTHTCVHIHPNNYFGTYKRKGIEIPAIAEFTFVRNDRAISKEFQHIFPHPLDSDNLHRKTVVLPVQWHR